MGIGLGLGLVISDCVFFSFNACLISNSRSLLVNFSRYYQIGGLHVETGTSNILLLPKIRPIAASLLATA